MTFYRIDPSRFVETDQSGVYRIHLSADEIETLARRSEADAYMARLSVTLPEEDVAAIEAISPPAERGRKGASPNRSHGVRKLVKFYLDESERLGETQDLSGLGDSVPADGPRMRRISITVPHDYAMAIAEAGLLASRDSRNRSRGVRALLEYYQLHAGK